MSQVDSYGPGSDSRPSSSHPEDASCLEGSERGIAPTVATHSTIFGYEDMEDPSIPPWILAQWVLETPLEGPLGTEPITLNPMVWVHPALAARIETARRRKVAAAPKALRSQGRRANGRTSHRVHFRDPVVEDVQQPPGHDPSLDARDMAWSTWSEASHGSYSGSAWQNEASERESSAVDWSHAWSSSRGSMDQWDSQQAWSQGWSGSWGEPNSRQGWDRPDSSDSTYTDWWQRQTSSWEAPVSWSDPWMTSSWSGSSSSSQPDWQTTSRATSSTTRSVGNAWREPQATQLRTEMFRHPSPPVRRGFKDEVPKSCYSSSAALPAGSSHTSSRDDFPSRPTAQREARVLERNPTPPPQRGGTWDTRWDERARIPSWSEDAVQAGSYRSVPRQAKVAERWKHPEGQDFSELHIGDVVEGIVTNVAKNGAFINFGAQKDGLLPAAVVRMKYGLLKVGDRVSDIEIEKLDPAKKQITLKISLSTNEATAQSSPFDRSNTDVAHRSSRKIVDADARRVGDQHDNCPVAWKGSHSIWTEGGTGGTRGSKE